MHEIVKKTGDFGIGQMIHAVHVVEDVQQLNQFYEDVFGALVYMGVDEPTYLAVEDRKASLLMVGELCIETMAPNTPVNTSLPVGKFYTKFGRHLHSVGYRVDDLDGLGDHMIGEGVYIGKPGGGRTESMAEITGAKYFFPSPRDTSGLMIEMAAIDMPGDPRLLPTWSSQVKMWESGHPLTIHRLAYATLGVTDVSQAIDVFTTRLQAIPIANGIDEIERCQYHLVQLGSCLIRLAQPLDAESELGKHVHKWGNTIYSITFGVRDLESARSWLAKKGVRAEMLGPHRLAANPEDCFGAPYFFTTEPIENDPWA